MTKHTSGCMQLHPSGDTVNVVEGDASSTGAMPLAISAGPLNPIHRSHRSASGSASGAETIMMRAYTGAFWPPRLKSIPVNMLRCNDANQRGHTSPVRRCLSKNYVPRADQGKLTHIFSSPQKR